MLRKYFGTDGVRGRAGAFPLDPATVFCLGRAVGRILGGDHPSALVGMDPRTSGRELAEALMAGLACEGASCRFAGVLPTPAVARLTPDCGFTMGVMISASHNPYTDNGIKFFSADGFKLPDEIELKVEGLLDDFLGGGGEAPERPSAPEEEGAFSRDYLEWLRERWPGGDLGGCTIAVDGANGAAHWVAPALFESLGARVVRRACEPDGTNINRDCGSLHLEGLRRLMEAEGAHLGLAFDGDADRCLALTPGGALIDGDAVLYLEALKRKAEKCLAGDLVVGTVMSNLWLERALSERGVRFHRAPVGDRYVLQAMREQGGEVGGEPSGHVILLDQATTGDGLLTALTVAGHMARKGSADALVEGICPYPQELRNLKVQRRVDLQEDNVILEALAAEEEALGACGRVVLRFSGTEPVLRLMVEASTENLMNQSLDRLEGILFDYLGREGRG